MNEIRWILLAAGVLLLAGIWWWGTRRPPRTVSEPWRERTDQRPSRHGSASIPSLEVRSDGDDSTLTTPFMRVLPEEEINAPFEPVRIDSGDTQDPALDSPVFIEPRLEINRTAEESMERVFVSEDEAQALRDEVIGRDGDAVVDDEEMSYTFEPSALDGLEPSSQDSANVDASPPAAPAAAPPAPRSDRTDASGRFARAKALEAKPVQAQCIVTLRVQPPGAAGWEGRKLLETLLSEHLVHGRYGVFHRLNGGQSVFSVANSKEPGTFDLQQMPDQKLHGITLFAVLPGPIVPAEALQEMLECAGRLASRLAGLLQDEAGEMLTADIVETLRAKVAKFEDDLREAAQ